MNLRSRYVLWVFGVWFATAASQLAAFAPTTALRPYDQAMRLSVIRNKQYHIKVGVEGSIADNPFNAGQHKTNALTVYDADQASIVAFRNPIDSSGQRKTAMDTLLRTMGNPADNGVRGHLKPSGTFSEITIMPNIGASFDLDGVLGHFALDVHVPVVRRQISSISIVDQTNTKLFLTPQDILVEQQMPNMLQNITTMGTGLRTDKWNTTGLGDSSIMLSWRNWFTQDKELVKGVELFGQLGVSLPTGVERDEDQAFAMPLGNDGAFGFPVGLGLNVQFINTIRAGLNIDFVPYLNKTKIRRIKTQNAQTEHFLLNKANVDRDYGLNWQFYLYLQSRHFVGGLSAKAAYQYLRHDNDKLTPRDNETTYDVLNSANSLQDWYAHNVILSIDYDHIHSSDALVVPQLSLFYKAPIAGKAVIAAHTIGAQIGFCF